MPTPTNPQDLLIQLRDEIRAAVGAGDFDHALELCDRAIACAREHGSGEDRDRAVCNRANILVAQGRGEAVIGEMRQLLMRSQAPSLRFQAADCISGVHAERREIERAIFYSRIALDHAMLSGIDGTLRIARINLSRLLLMDSRFADARVHLQAALGQMADEDESLERGLTLSNLAYCDTLLGDLDSGFRRGFSSLRSFRRQQAGNWLRLPHLVLSYAYLEAERYGRARSHATRALEWAEVTPNGDEHVKNALYLLGEAEKLEGMTEHAFSRFSKLQERFYPHEPFVVDVLMSTDIRPLVNLMA
ncbi:MAG: hypothetical protein AAGE94_05550 [Acidobacteriota bacterium]